MDWTQTKIIKHTYYLAFIKCQQPFRFSEIRATDRQNHQETQPDITPTRKQNK